MLAPKATRKAIAGADRERYTTDALSSNFSEQQSGG